MITQQTHPSLPPCTTLLKDLIILCGRNLYPQDLERTAERSHADLNPCGGAAFSVQSDGQERLVLAYEVIPRREPDVNAVLASQVLTELTQQGSASLSPSLSSLLQQVQQLSDDQVKALLDATTVVH